MSSEVKFKFETAYDFIFDEIMERIGRSRIPDEFSIIYDFAKRIYNTYGMSFDFIKHIYFFGIYKDTIIELSKRL